MLYSLHSGHSEDHYILRHSVYNNIHHCSSHIDTLIFIVSSKNKKWEKFFNVSAHFVLRFRVLLLIPLNFVRTCFELGIEENKLELSCTKLKSA